MKLNVIIATFNRSALLRKTLTSLFEAERTPDLDVVVTIVDTSTDNTREVVEEFQSRNDLDLRYIFEPRRGKSRALNTGIEQSDAELIGLTDDDIEALAKNFKGPADFCVMRQGDGLTVYVPDLVQSQVRIIRLAP